MLYCSCVLPWRAAGAWWPEEDIGDVAGMTKAAIERLGAGLSAAAGSVVWGGDWNHALRDSEYAGTHDGREAIGKLVTKLGLRVPTEHLAHAKPGLLSIDHIAVPTTWDIAGCRRVVAVADGRRLSDHDAYVLDARP
jgi:endonuclease/exonuclease/phosphatase family metal-dependent hydrolase